MIRYENRNGYIFQVEGAVGREIYVNMGKDPNDPKWETEINEISEKLNGN